MKKLLICLIFILVPTIAFAGTWCQWDEVELEGVNCQTTTKVYIIINGVPVTVSAENLNPRGWYELTTTEPVIGEDQTKDLVEWTFVDDEIFKTWTVRDLTAEEIDGQIAGVMDVNDWYLWTVLLKTGTITPAQAQTYLPAALIEAYQARDRLENPE